MDEIPNIRSAIGTSRKTLEEIKVGHSEMTLLAERTIGEIEGTDLAEAMTLIAQNASQIEASFATLSRLTNISLLDFI